MDEKLLDNIKALLERLRGLAATLDVEGKSARVAGLEAKMSKPGFWESGRQDEVISELKSLKATVEPIVETEAALEDAAVLAELALSEKDEATFEEAQGEYTRLKKALAKIETGALLTGPHDSRDCFIYIHAGAGGVDSCDWAEMLMRMYLRYCEQKRFSVEVVDILRQEEAGIKNVALHVKGANAYGYLRSETGVHRLVRMSPFDFNKRRHTSFAAVEVMPEFDEQAEIQIDQNEIKVETFRASGPGGQHVNVTDSAVRITHTPTGIVVQSQSQRSQFANRREAMSMLRSRLYQRQEAKRASEMAKLYSEKGEIAWGNQIRSYVLHPYQLAKDHRTGEETSSVQSVLDGDIEKFIEAYLRSKAGGK